MKNYDCVVIGRTCIDYIALVNKYPQKNTKIPFLEYKICIGGQGANSAIVLSSLGIKTLLVTPLGEDLYGKLAKNFFSKYKLDILISNKNIKTPCAFIWTEQKSAERTIVYEKIKSNILYPKYLLKKVIKNTKYILFDHQSSKDLLKVINSILKYKIKLMMDAERKDIYMFKLLPNINYFICSEELVKELKLNIKQFLKKFIQLGPEVVCCTLGEKGAVAIVKGSNKIYKTNAINIKSTDTTGAGDVFHAGFMYGIIKGWRIKKILSFANKIAGISTKYFGGSSFVEQISSLQFLKD